MTGLDTYVALPFVISGDGVATGEPAECMSAHAALMRAEALSRSRGMPAVAFSRPALMRAEALSRSRGRPAVAFSRTGDPSRDNFSDARLIRKLATCRTI